MVEEERAASVCPCYHRRLRLFTTDTLWHCTTAEFGTARISSHHDGDVASSMMLYSNWSVGVWSESTAGQQRGTGRPICHSRTGRDLRGPMKRPAELQRVSARASPCQSHVPHVPESTLGNKMVSNRDKRGWNQRSSERGTKNNTRSRHKVTRLFFKRFVFYRGGIQTPSPPKKSLFRTVSCHGNFSGQCSPCCCSCSALQDLRFATQNRTLRPNVARPSSKSNEPTTFCCISSVWTLAGNLRMLPGVENLKGHPYIVLFLLLVCVCVRVRMCYVKTKNISSNVGKENKSDISWTTITVARRGVRSSPVLLCNESH